jgi:hypothetical protein
VSGKRQRPPTREERRKLDDLRRMILFVVGWLADQAWLTVARHNMEAQHKRSLRQAEEARRLSSGVSEVEAATIAVRQSVAELAVETSRSQRLAIRVGVATAILGAILGGFAGAFAARIVGS